MTASAPQITSDVLRANNSLDLLLAPSIPSSDG